MPTLHSLRLVVPTVALVLLLIACNGGPSKSGSSSSAGVSIEASGAFSVPTAERGLDLPPSPTPPPAPAAPPPTATPQPPPPPSPTPVPVAPTLTPVPPPAPAPAQPAPQPPAQPAAPAPASLVSFKPETLQQGGMAVVYLNTEASTAVLSFGGKQYAMAKDGARWWAIVGVAATASAGDAAAVVTYTAPGGASQQASARIPIVAKQWPVENITLTPGAASLLAPDIINAEIAQRNGIYAQYSPQRLWTGPFVRPNAAELSDVYGVFRSYNGAPATDYHKGTDFAGFTGSPVVAAAAGRVAYAGELKVRGGSVIIDHGMGVFTAYHHFSRIDVAQGQMVAAGQGIGAVGETGLVTGPHLHWEVIVRGVEVDGLLWLQGREVGP
jgi:murein DD-endopeptidase MepM/ murein hydrolase activator NlpD